MTTLEYNDPVSRRRNGLSHWPQATRIRMVYTEAVIRAIKDAAGNVLTTNSKRESQRIREEALEFLLCDSRQEDRDRIFSHTSISVHAARRVVAERAPRAFKKALERYATPA